MEAAAVTGVRMGMESTNLHTKFPKRQSMSFSLNVKAEKQE
jgi:hypothetical protein